MNYFIRNYFSKTISESKRIQKTLRKIDVFNMHRLIFSQSKNCNKIEGVYVLEGEALQAQNILMKYYFELFINRYINSYATLDVVFESIPLFMKAIQEFDPDKGYAFSTFLQSTLTKFKLKQDNEINIGTVVPKLRRALFDATNKHFLLHGEYVDGELLIEDESIVKSVEKYRDKMLNVTTSIDNTIGSSDDEESFTLQDIIGVEDDGVDVETEANVYKSKYAKDIEFINAVYDGLIEATVSTDKLNLKRRKSIFNSMINSKELQEKLSFVKDDSKLLNDVTARLINETLPENLKYHFDSEKPRLFKENVRNMLKTMLDEIQTFLHTSI